METNTEIGQKGEKLAAEYLAHKGYTIIALNWHYKHKEIDILAHKGNWVIVVEVKLRKNDYFGHPSEFVTRQKQRFLIEAAEAYVDTLSTDPDVRFDIISILGSDGNYTLEHLEDAFTANP